MSFRYIKVKTKGQIEGEKLLVPKLRFKEFKDEWKEISLVNVFTFYNTNSLSRADLSEEGLIKNIHYGDIHQKFNNILDVNKEKLPYIKSDIKVNIHNEENYCQDGDLILADASEDYDGIGKAVEVINVGNNIIVSGLHTILARDTNKVMSLGFKGYLFNTPLIHNQIRVLANGFKVYGISKNNIYDLDVRIPTKTEQEKITNFLILLDKKIELQQRRIEALKIYKKGLIQKYFESKNGEKIKISEILEEVINKTTENNQYEVISSTKDGLFLQNEYFNRSIASDNNIGYKILKKNQIVLSPQNLWMGNINYNNKYEIGMVSPSYKIFNINKKFDKDYISNLLKTNKAIYYYTINSEQGASIVRRNLNMESFYEINFVIPDIAEQNKKGKIINEITQKIEKEEKKYQKLDKLKKGLLQKMFI